MLHKMTSTHIGYIEAKLQISSSGSSKAITHVYMYIVCCLHVHEPQPFTCTFVYDVQVVQAPNGKTPLNTSFKYSLLYYSHWPPAYAHGVAGLVRLHCTKITITRYTCVHVHVHACIGFKIKVF